MKVVRVFMAAYKQPLPALQLKLVTQSEVSSFDKVPRCCVREWLDPRVRCLTFKSEGGCWACFFFLPFLDYMPWSVFWHASHLELYPILLQLSPCYVHIVVKEYVTHPIAINCSKTMVLRWISTPQWREDCHCQWFCYCTVVANCGLLCRTKSAWWHHMYNAHNVIIIVMHINLMRRPQSSTFVEFYHHSWEY